MKQAKKVNQYIVEEKESGTVKDALLKKALGYKVSEISEEYSIVDEKLVLVKRKVNTKQFPPDLDAIELMLGKEEYESEFENLSDVELLEEKQKVIEMLEKIKEKNINESV